MNSTKVMTSWRYARRVCRLSQRATQRSNISATALAKLSTLRATASV
jgi:hypothetical protein